MTPARQKDSSARQRSAARTLPCNTNFSVIRKLWLTKVFADAEYQLRLLHFRGVAAGCGKVDMQIVDIRRREQFFYHRFELLPVD
jgi:hypothetical protein